MVLIYFLLVMVWHFCNLSIGFLETNKIKGYEYNKLGCDKSISFVRRRQFLPTSNKIDILSFEFIQISARKIISQVHKRLSSSDVIFRSQKFE